MLDNDNPAASARSVNREPLALITPNTCRCAGRIPSTSVPASPRDASSARNRRNRFTSSWPIGRRSGGGGGVDCITHYATVPEASATVVKLRSGDETGTGDRKPANGTAHD